jgi:hypothetical protein
MTSPFNTYNKQNSFIDILHHKTLEDVFTRIRNLKERLATLPLSEYEKNIIQSACSELLEPETIDNKINHFKSNHYNLDEIYQLENKDLPKYLYYRYRYEIFSQRLQLDDFPPCLQIEPASICNYRYLFCYQIDEEFTRKSNVSPADVYFGRNREILTKRDQIKRKTLALRRKQNLKTRVA